MTDYASSYLIIKAQLAATYKLGGEAAFNLKKEELKTYVKAVYAAANPKGSEELCSYIDAITPLDLTPDAIGMDSAKIAAYGVELPKIVEGVSSLKTMKPILDATQGILSKDKEMEKIVGLLGNLNNSDTQILINKLGTTLMSFSEEEIKGIGSLLSNVKTTERLIDANKENIAQINGLLGQLKAQPNLKSDLNSFKIGRASCRERV